jgi:hypothetical protein
MSESDTTVWRMRREGEGRDEKYIYTEVPGSSYPMNPTTLDYYRIIVDQRDVEIVKLKAEIERLKGMDQKGA